MNYVKLYIYNDKGYYTHTRTGNIDSVVDSIEDCEELFTLTPVPEIEDPTKCRWVDDKWTTDDTAT